MRRGRLRGLAGGAVAAGLLLSACGGGDSAVGRADERVIEPLDVDALPAEMLGLSIEREDIEEILNATKRPYLQAASLYSLREGDELQATLQIGAFADDAEYAEDSFRRSLLATLGGGSIRELRVGGRPVFLTTGDRQQVAIWFEEDLMVVLSTREEFEQPRTLLRNALELEL